MKTCTCAAQEQVEEAEDMEAAIDEAALHFRIWHVNAT